jgi:hypothetical protein
MTHAHFFQHRTVYQTTLSLLFLEQHFWLVGQFNQVWMGLNLCIILGKTKYFGGATSSKGATWKTKKQKGG